MCRDKHVNVNVSVYAYKTTVSFEAIWQHYYFTEIWCQWNMRIDATFPAMEHCFSLPFLPSPFFLLFFPSFPPLHFPCFPLCPFPVSGSPPHMQPGIPRPLLPGVDRARSTNCFWCICVENHLSPALWSVLALWQTSKVFLRWEMVVRFRADQGTTGLMYRSHFQPWRKW